MRTDSAYARIDAARTLAFTFDGVALSGHPGDTLASALVANGVRVVGCSTYLGRPRGMLAAGVEEPNAFVAVDLGTHTQPSVRATTQELYDGLTARSLAGRARVDGSRDPSRYDRMNAHCDVLVVGAGPAGLTAALAAAETGARVMLVDEQQELGGTLLHSGETVDGRSGVVWVSDVAARLAESPEVTLLPRTTALGVFDDGYVVAVERRTEHLPPQHAPRLARQRVWHIRARRLVLATGAIERPIVFADNDRPGVMLAGAAWTYAARYAAAPGRRAVVFTTDDSAYTAAEQLLAGGVEIAAVVDSRPDARACAARLLEQGVRVHAGGVVSGTVGDSEGVVTAVRVHVDGAVDDVRCDLVAVCGGWTPTLHLYAQARGELVYDPAIAAHVPRGTHERLSVVGSAAGAFTLGEALAEGAAAGAGTHRAEARAGRTPAATLWAVPPAADDGWGRHFVDLQRDATVADLHRAVDAGLHSLEHIKRYTSIGTGSDQGKTSNVNAIGIVADLLGEPIERFAPTTYRAPYTPVPFAVLAGRERGALHDPVRVTAIHPWHVRRGAVFEDVGQWKRPSYYPSAGEDRHAATQRECAAVRSGVGIFDGSTLGKIDVRGADAAEFLDRMYATRLSTLGVGKCRYVLMCHADGTVLDDGVAQRLAENRYLVTTSTGNAARVFDWLEEWLQSEWPELNVRLTSVTDHWAVIAIAGPGSRAVVAALAPGVGVDNDAMPFMAVRETEVAGAPARLCRISFSGELAFEIYVPARFGLAVWDAAMAAGADAGITPYGMEAVHVLRAEKGYVIVGQDTDSTTTPHDAGLAWAAGGTKDFFVGRRSHRRPAQMRDDRRQLVGLLPEDPGLRLPEGAPVLSETGAAAGHVTSSYESAALGRTFAMALLAGGRQRLGEMVEVSLDNERRVRALVTETVFYDPEGSRRDGDPAQRD